VKEVVELSLLDDETFLHTLLSGPILSMSLPLDEDLGAKRTRGVSFARGSLSQAKRSRAVRTNLLGVHASVPPHSNRLSSLRLLESTEVEFEIVVIEVDGGDGSVGRVELLLRVEDCREKSDESAFQLSRALEVSG